MHEHTRDPGKPEYSEAEIHAAVTEARRGVYVAAHAHGEEAIERAIRAGVRSVEHASPITDQGIALVKQHGTWLARRRACWARRDLGSTSPGKAADPVAVACDPLHDVDCLRQVRGMIKAGQPFPMD